jgi:hypothetical protein
MMESEHHEPVAEGAHGEAVGHAEGHEGGHEGGHTPELENFWNLLAKSSLNKEGTFTGKIIKQFDPYVENAQEANLHKVIQNVFFGIVSVALCGSFWGAACARTP